jgi:hypothetical protein
MKDSLRFPGLASCLSRATDEATMGVLAPVWRAWLQKNGVEVKWNAAEGCDVFQGTGSRVYLRGCLSTDATRRYSKLAGLTLAKWLLDEAHEVPGDVISAFWPARLSQPGYPHQMLFLANPGPEDSWLSRQFPLGGRARADREVIAASVYENQRVLGRAYIQSLEDQYPPGSALHRRLVLGKRGLGNIGEAVFGGVFRRDIHVADTQLDPEVAIVCGFDWGHKHPAAVWVQFTPQGQIVLLGGVMGSDMFIEDFLPAVARWEAEWFPEAQQRWYTGDPAGDAKASQGQRQSASDLARAYGYVVQTIGGANLPEVRNRAIQVLAQAMRRLTGVGPGFVVDRARWVELGPGSRVKLRSEVMVDGLEAGLTWDERTYQLGQAGNVRRVMKEGQGAIYTHLFDALTYCVLRFGPGAMTAGDVARERARAERRASRDDRDRRERDHASWPRWGGIVHEPRY